MGSLTNLIDHGLCDQADSVRRPAKPFRVEHWILAHDQTIRDAHATLDDDIAQMRPVPDIDLRQDDSVSDVRVGMHSHTREYEGPPQRRTGNDRPTGDHRGN